MLRQMYAWGRWCCDQIGLEYDWPVSDEAEERLHWQKRIENDQKWALARRKPR
jgi:hypothetical protein